MSRLKSHFSWIAASLVCAMALIACGDSNLNDNGEANAELLKEALTNMRAARTYHLSSDLEYLGQQVTFVGDVDLTNKAMQFEIDRNGVQESVILIGGAIYLSDDGGVTYTESPDDVRAGSINSSLEAFTNMFDGFRPDTIDNTDITNKGLAMHYDGKAWAEVSLPLSPGKVSLTDVRVFGPESAWASSFAGPINSFNSESLSSEIFSWDGTKWSSVTLPDPPASTCGDLATTRLTSIDGVSSGDIWAVGYCKREGYDGALGAVTISKTLSYHFTNGKWTMVEMPNPYMSQSVYAIGVSPEGTVWLAGQEDVPNRVELSYTYASGGRPVVNIWNGTQWLEVPSIQPYARVDDIYGTQGFADIGFTEEGRVWAVGHVGKYIYEGFDALVEVFTPCAK